MRAEATVMLQAQKDKGLAVGNASPLRLLAC